MHRLVATEAVTSSEAAAAQHASQVTANPPTLVIGTALQLLYSALTQALYAVFCIPHLHVASQDGVKRPLYLVLKSEISEAGLDATRTENNDRSIPDLVHIPVDPSRSRNRTHREIPPCLEVRLYSRMCLLVYL